jgi:acetolactate synthase-1/2/3 large subunit
MSKPSLRSGGQLIVDNLALHGVDQVFCVPGESYLAVLDALHDANSIAVTVCRQEGGAAMMADAYGKLTGKPGICFVTRGPGATNASPGVHIAFQDSTPLILFIGQVGRSMVDREAFQEIDYRRMFGQMAKWVAQIDDARRIPEYLARAFATATSGRPGPVVLALPEDMLRDKVAAPPAQAYRRVVTRPGAEDLAAFTQRLTRAQQPLLVLGGSGWSPDGVAAITRFAEAWDLPVGCSFRRQDRLDNMSEHYVGDVGIGINPKLAARVKESDCLVLLGGRLGEMPSSGYSLLQIPDPAQPFIHVHAGAEELGRVYQPDLAINATPGAFAEALAKLPAPTAKPWAAWRKEARADYLVWSTPPKTPGPLQMGEVIRTLEQRLGPDAIWCNGAGNYATWLHRFHRYGGYGTQLAPTSGSMGYGTPAAVGAKRSHPDKPVVAFAGDGCFLMNGQELATAVQYDLPILIVVVNNGSYGTIRMHQERHYPGRVSATELKNPAFAELAKAYGAFGEKVERTEDFAAALDRALASGKPALLELILDKDIITPTTTLSAIRAASLAKPVPEGE